ncbi:hypothetical protein ACH9DO_14870 [Kocuria sp. M1N1S27]|uniref:hypothetical protein n=1 Tax=Kocuria kalidii TaxID=3376283 RepID=UPI0037B90AB8
MNAPQTLGALIRDLQVSTGWSYRDLAQRSPAGTGLNKSRWGELRRDEVKTFSGAQLLGIAETLGLPASIVGRAALATMGVTARDGSAARVEDAVRTDNELSEHDRRILLAVLREMRMERGGNADSTAPITHAGESPAADQERRERPTGDTSLPPVVTGQVSSAQAAEENELAEMLPHADREQYPAAGIHEDELSRWRREREAAEDVGQEGIPLPDEALMVGYDEPQESILAREQQDEDAEGRQEGPEGQ